MIHPLSQDGVQRIFVAPHEKRAKPAAHEGPDRIEARGSPKESLQLLLGCSKRRRAGNGPAEAGCLGRQRFRE